MTENSSPMYRHMQKSHSQIKLVNIYFWDAEETFILLLVSQWSKKLNELWVNLWMCQLAITASTSSKVFRRAGILKEMLIGMIKLLYVVNNLFPIWPRIIAPLHFLYSFFNFHASTGSRKNLPGFLQSLWMLLLFTWVGILLHVQEMPPHAGLRHIRCAFPETCLIEF